MPEIILRKWFGDPPRQSQDCQINTKVPVNQPYDFLGLGKTLQDINPERVYQIHEVIAGQGKKLASRWGHAMTRLVICAPERKTVGPECLKDVDYHLTFAYNAEIDNKKWYIYKGITGGYPSIGSFIKFTDMLDHYTLRGNRQVNSYPLQLSTEAKKMAIYKMLEDVYQYKGKYRIGGENCATKEYHLLQCALPDFKLQAHTPVTPSRIHKALVRNKLIMPLDIQKRNKESEEGNNVYDRKYFWPSMKDQFSCFLSICI